MKYQEGLKTTKEFLKLSTVSEIKQYCELAGLTDQETELLILRFRQGKNRDCISYDKGICLTSLSTKYTVILKLVKKVLTKAGLIDEDFLN